MIRRLLVRMRVRRGGGRGARSDTIRIKLHTILIHILIAHERRIILILPIPIPILTLILVGIRPILAFITPKLPLLLLLIVVLSISVGIRLSIFKSRKRRRMRGDIALILFLTRGREGQRAEEPAPGSCPLLGCLLVIGARCGDGSLETSPPCLPVLLL